jgi:hypothetical protein
VVDGTRGAHPDDPAEGSREQGEEAEARVRAGDAGGADRDDETDGRTDDDA